MVIARLLAESVWRRAHWLVLAPHPDDETLGAGALIRHAAFNGNLSQLVYLTDGTGSHPDGTPGLASARRREARHAVRCLSAQHTSIAWLGWKDASPHKRGSKAFARDAQRLAALLRRDRVDAIAVTDASESHCDHQAAFELAHEAARRARRSIALFTYRVWSKDAGEPARRVRTRTLNPGTRRRALQAHRSQLSSAYGDGFRLPHDQQRMASFDILTLQGERA